MIRGTKASSIDTLPKAVKVPVREWAQVAVEAVVETLLVSVVSVARGESTLVRGGLVLETQVVVLRVVLEVL